MYEFNQSERQRLFEQCAIFFVEIADGIYYVEKDRFCEFGGDEFVSPNHVIAYLNNNDYIVVVERRGLQKTLISNYHFA